MTDHALTTTESPRPKPPAMSTGGAVGALVPQTLEEAFRLASAMAASGMTPRDIDTPEKVLVAIMAGAELGMKPFQACQSFAIVNGRPSLWGDGLMALALTNGLDVEEWIEGEGDNRVAFCRVTRPDNGKVVTRDYSVEKAKTAKLWGKVSANGKPSPWVTSPDRMLQMRARSYAIRDAAADVLRGFQIREEVEDYGEAVEVETPKAGTGLLAKFQANETLAEEGFGIRNLETEAGEAAPAAEPKKRGRPPKAKSVAQEALDAMPDGALAAIAEAEPEIVAQVVEDHGDTPVPDYPEAAAEAYADAAETPADAEVEEAAPVTPEPAQEPSAAISGEVAAEGHAEPGEVYFLASEPAFVSGRRACYRDGLPLDSVEDGTHPVYSEHAPRKAAAPKPAPAAEAPAEPTPSDPSPSPSDGSTSQSPTAPPDGSATSASPSDPFQAFEQALTAAKSWPDLRPALAELSRSPEWKARPDDVRRVRCDVWDLVGVWNEAGAKLDPVDDAFLFQAYVTATDDAESIEGTLALVQDSDWYKAASPEMQAGVGRFVMARTQAIRGG